MDTNHQTHGTIFGRIQCGVNLLTVVGAFVFGAIIDSWAEETTDQGDPPVSFARQTEAFRILASRGDLDAKKQLAERYERGLGVPQNFAKAISLYREAAMDGHVPARRRLASLGVSLLPPEPRALSSSAEPETDGQTLRLVISRSEHIAAKDTSFFAAAQSSLAREVLFVVSQGHNKQRFRISRHRDNRTGPSMRRIGHGALGAKAQRNRAVGVARSGATGLRTR